MRLSFVALQLCLAAAVTTFTGVASSATVATTTNDTNNSDDNNDAVSIGPDAAAHRIALDDETCDQHEIDFVLVEGDAVRSSVEQEIVSMLAEVGIKVNTRKLTKEEFNAAEQAGDFHMSFSETWGAPYDPHAYAKGWIAKDEGHNQALSGVEEPNSRQNIYDAIENVLREGDSAERRKQWKVIHEMVHKSAVMLPMWGKRVPTVLNDRFSNFQAGNQQFDYPVHRLDVEQGSSTATISPGAQTGLFTSVGRLDPHTYRPNEFFSSNWVYEGLVSYGNFGQIVPALAQSWQMLSDGITYRFKLRPGVTFHDGAPWNCAAAKLNFDHVLADPLRTPDWHGWYGLIDQIKSWDCGANDLEFIVKTKDKYYPFLQEMSFIRPLRMLSPAAFANDGDPITSNSCHVGWGTIDEVQCAGITDISGTGPWMFDSRDEKEVDGTIVDNQVVFKANPNYWDKNEKPSIETLIIKRYEDSNAVKAALLNGDLDIVWGSGVLTTDDLIELDANGSNGLSVDYSDDIQNVIILLNSGKAPLNDINIRKTIMHAINKNKITEDNLGGLFKPVYNVFPRDAPFSDVDLNPKWDYDLETARFLNCNPIGSPGTFVGGGIKLLTDVKVQLDRDKKLRALTHAMRSESCESLAAGRNIYNDDSYFTSMPHYKGSKGIEMTLYDNFYGSGFLDTWVNAAFNNDKASFKNSAADFSKLPGVTDGSGNCVGREEAVKKVLAYTSTYIDLNQYFEESIDEIQKGCNWSKDLYINGEPNTNPCTKAVNAWEKALATWSGSMEGEYGRNLQEPGNSGMFLQALAEKRCVNFKTCGLSKDDATNDGVTPRANMNIVSAFAKGRNAVFNGQLGLTRRVVSEINKELTVSLIQGVLRYSYRVGKNLSKLDKEIAEGGAFAFGLLPQIYACNKRSAKILAANTDIGGDRTSQQNGKTASFQNVRAALECNYKCLGIRFADVGELNDCTNPSDNSKTLCFGKRPDKGNICKIRNSSTFNTKCARVAPKDDKNKTFAKTRFGSVGKKQFS